MNDFDPGLQRRSSGHREPPRTQRRDDGASRQGTGPSPLMIGAAVAIVIALAAAAFVLLSGDEPQVVIEAKQPSAVTAERLNELNPKYDKNEIVALLDGPGPSPVAGTYTVDTGLETVDMVRTLQAAWVDADPGLTFPEGFTVQKIAARIAKNRWQYTVDGLVGAAEGLTVDPRIQRPAGTKSAEGLLFPNTYSVGSDIDASRTMGQMLVTMQSLVFDDLQIEAASQKLGLTPYQLITVASLIEKEAKTDNDRTLISRVIHNRLQRGMKLQIDASNFYQAPEGATFSELRELDTPYNLYLYEGLPPTPIANPGRASLAAALQPAPPVSPDDPRCAEVAEADCALLFYVLSDAEGNHAFAVTNAQHEDNIAAAREAGVL